MLGYRSSLEPLPGPSAVTKTQVLGSSWKSLRKVLPPTPRRCMAAVSVVVSPGKEHAKVVVHLQTRPGFPDDRRVGGGTVTGPRDHLLSVDQIRLVKEARGPPTSLGRVPGSELCALVCVPDWVVRVNMKGPCKEVQKNEDQEGEAAATGPQAETLEAKKSWTANSHSALETEGASSSHIGVLIELT